MTLERGVFGASVSIQYVLHALFKPSGCLVGFLLATFKGESDPDCDDEEGTMYEVPPEPIEADLELKLHVLGFKAIWSQTSPQLVDIQQ